jgi:2-hydroxychromene-2-carboxylate isomerase
MSDVKPALASAELEFWFEFGSNYSYLSVMRIEAAAARLQVHICWKPFLLGPIFRTLGWDTSPFVLQKAKGEYVWKDMERACRDLGLPWIRPTTFPRTALLPMRVALVGAEQPWMAYCRRVMSLNFAEDRDIDAPDVVADVLERWDCRPGKSSMRLDPSLPLKLGEQTRPRVPGIRHVPCWRRDVWGNDRLDDALACASRRLKPE